MRLLERSVFSDRMVFVRAVHEAQYMSDLELSVYDSWFEPIVDVIPTIVPDGFIYLQADPDTCMRRLIRRQRAEEKTVRTAYLWPRRWCAVLHKTAGLWSCTFTCLYPEHAGLAAPVDCSFAVRTSASAVSPTSLRSSVTRLCPSGDYRLPLRAAHQARGVAGAPRVAGAASTLLAPLMPRGMIGYWQSTSDHVVWSASCHYSRMTETGV